MGKNLRTCGQCRHLYKGRCDAPLPHWVYEIDPIGNFRADENRERESDADAKYCDVFKPNPTEVRKE